MPRPRRCVAGLSALSLKVVAFAGRVVLRLEKKDLSDLGLFLVNLQRFGFSKEKPCPAPSWGVVSIVFE